MRSTRDAERRRHRFQRSLWTNADRVRQIVAVNSIGHDPDDVTVNVSNDGNAERALYRGCDATLVREPVRARSDRLIFGAQRQAKHWRDFAERPPVQRAAHDSRENVVSTA